MKARRKDKTTVHIYLKGKFHKKERYYIKIDKFNPNRAVFNGGLELKRVNGKWCYFAS